METKGKYFRLAKYDLKNLETVKRGYGCFTENEAGRIALRIAAEAVTKQ